MSAWRHLLLDSRTMAIVAELPLISCRFGDVLNDRGSFSATMPLAMDNGLTLVDFDPPKAVFVAERDGVPVWAGFVWTWECDIESDTFTISGEGWLSYFGRIFRTDGAAISADPIEQTSIATALLDYAQGGTKSYANVNVDTSVAQATGVLRYRSFPHYEGKSIEELLKSISGSNVLQGLDFTFLPRWEGSPPTLWQDFYVHPTPEYGRDSGIVLELGANADLTGLSGDGSQATFRSFVIGAGDEVLALSASAEDSVRMSNSRRLESVERATDVSVLTTLQDKAQRNLDVYSRTLTVPRVRIGETFLGQFTVGDRVTVRGAYGLVDLNDTYRITAWEASIDDGAQTLVNLTLAPLALFLEA